MIEAANKLGFQAKGVKGTPESLAKIPKPAIAHVKISPPAPGEGVNEAPSGGLGAGLLHYVVIYDVIDKHVTVMDPAKKYIYLLSVCKLSIFSILRVLSFGFDNTLYKLNHVSTTKRMRNSAASSKSFTVVLYDLFMI